MDYLSTLLPLAFEPSSICTTYARYLAPDEAFFFPGLLPLMPLQAYRNGARHTWPPRCSSTNPCHHTRPVLYQLHWLIYSFCTNTRPKTRLHRDISHTVPPCQVMSARSSKPSTLVFANFLAKNPAKRMAISLRDPVQIFGGLKYDQIVMNSAVLPEVCVDFAMTSQTSSIELSHGKDMFVRYVSSSSLHFLDLRSPVRRTLPRIALLQVGLVGLLSG